MKIKDNSLLRSQCYINGEWVDADSGKTVDVSNPATGEVICAVPYMGEAETRRAIEGAQEAFHAWKTRPAKERSVILRRWYDLMIEHQDDLATIMTIEQGKPWEESRGEIVYAASFLEWFAEEARRAYGDTVPSPWADKRIVILKEPIGVTAAVTPWNFPAAMITRKCGPALAAGCPMVVKPATATPLSALALADLADRAGVPAGIFSVVTGSAREIGGEMTSNPIVRKLTFTGSTDVGKMLTKQCADTLKKVSMELGGNAPVIVFDDADLDAAVEGTMIAKFRNMGQTCVCANRIYAQAGIYDKFVDALAAKISALKVGNGLEEGMDQGPLIDAGATAKVAEHIADAVSHGARVVTGGKPHALGGTFFEPTLVADVPPTAMVAKEETFGPLAPVFKFETEEDVIGYSNDTDFGLASYFFTRDMGRVWRVAEALEYGIVGINTGLISTTEAPFGGVKESGFGREGSKYGMDDFMETKYLCMGGL